MNNILNVRHIFFLVMILLPLAACAEKTERDVQNTEKVKTVEYGVPAAKEQAVAEKATKEVAVTAPDFDFMEGVHYLQLPKRVTPLVPASKIEVVEMFFYGCPHCFYLEPHAVVWKSKLADDVDFRVIPAALNPTWGTYARAYYAAEQLGVLNNSHELLFKSIHEQGRRFTGEDALVRFFVRQGADEAEFKKAMKSPAVMAKVKRAETLGKEYGLTGVPSLIVDGQYRVLMDSIASYDELFQIVDFLVEKVRKHRSASG